MPAPLFDGQHDEAGLQRLWATLRREAGRLTGDQDLAQDLVQETLLTAWRSQSPLVTDLPWWRVVLRNAYLSWLRGERRRRRREEAAERTLRAPGDEVVPDRLLRALIRGLPEAESVLVHALYAQGISCEQFARLHGMSATSARRLRDRTLLRLRRAIADGESDASERRIRNRLALLVAPVWRVIARNAAAGQWLLAAGSIAALIALFDRGAGPVPPSYVDPSSLRGAISAEELAPATAVPQLAHPPSRRAHSSERRPTPATEIRSVAAGSDDASANCESHVSLQKMVDEAAPGSTLRVPPCLFRERITVDKPLVLQAEPGSEIRGSDVWHKFAAVPQTQGAGPRWTSRRSVPAFDWEHAARRCGDDNGAPCAEPEQVFLDGKALQRIGSPLAVRSGQFALDEQRRVVLGQDPSGHLLEVSVRTEWMIIRANDVTVTGFTMRHAANLAKFGGALHVQAESRGAHIAGNRLLQSSGVALNVQGPGHRVIGNEIADAGWEGLQVTQTTAASGVEVLGNDLHHNGALLALARTRWVNAGIMVLDGWATLKGNRIHRNHGLGVFLVRTNGSVVRDNRISDNLGAGIAGFASERASITGNTIENNGRGAEPREPEVMLVRTRAFQFFGNDIRSARRGIFVGPAIAPARPGPGSCAGSLHNSFHDNRIGVPAGVEPVELGGEEAGQPCPFNLATGNVLFATTP